MLKKVPNQTPDSCVARPTQTSIAAGTGRGAIRARLLVFLSLAVAMTFTSLVSAKRFSDWGAAVNVESIAGTSSELNTTFNEGYPVLSPDGLCLYIVSDRPGAIADLDIWTASRGTTSDDWSTPTNMGPLINTAATEARATLSRDGLTMFFGSNRVPIEQSDIYVTTREKLTGNNR